MGKMSFKRQKGLGGKNSKSKPKNLARDTKKTLKRGPKKSTTVCELLEEAGKSLGGVSLKGKFIR